MDVSCGGAPVLLALAVGGALAAVPGDRIGGRHAGLLRDLVGRRRLHVAVQVHRQGACCRASRVLPRFEPVAAVPRGAQVYITDVLLWE